MWIMVDGGAIEVNPGEEKGEVSTHVQLLWAGVAETRPRDTARARVSESWPSQKIVKFVGLQVSLTPSRRPRELP